MKSIKKQHKEFRAPVAGCHSLGAILFLTFLASITSTAPNPNTATSVATGSEGLSKPAVSPERKSAIEWNVVNAAAGEN